LDQSPSDVPDRRARNDFPGPLPGRGRMCGSGNVHERLPESGFMLEHRFSETRVGDHARGDEGAHDFGHDRGFDVRFGEN